MYQAEDLMKYSKTFRGEKDCFIHVEMKEGKRCERLIGGGYAAILHGLCGAIATLADKTGKTFADVIDDVKEWNLIVSESWKGGGDA